MNPRPARFPAACFCIVLLASFCAAQAPGSEKLFELPEYKRVQLPNGLTLILLEKRALPMISVEIGLRSGSVADPAGKEGTASLTATLLRKGTASRSTEQISADLDFIGMEYDARVDQDATRISADFLKKDLDTALPLLADLLLHPAFPEAEMKKKVAQEQDAIRSAKDDPRAVIRSYFLKFLFADHPYGRPPGGDERSLANISRDDIAAFYRAHYTPANTVIAMVGDLEVAAIQAKVAEVFVSWKGKAPADAAVPVFKPVTGKRVMLVDKPDATQTYFMIGNVGISSTNADRGYINVVNTLFGGRFTSLFNTELRIKSGYSYGAYSFFDQKRSPGPFIMSTFTKNATTGPALAKSFEVLETLHQKGFNTAELTSAKTYIRGTLPPSFETSPQLARALAGLELSGITRDQFNQNLAREQSTGDTDAHRAIETYFPDHDYVLVMIGKASEIRDIAGKYSDKVILKKISDPGF